MTSRFTETHITIEPASDHAVHGSMDLYAASQGTHEGTARNEQSGRSAVNRRPVWYIQYFEVMQHAESEALAGRRLLYHNVLSTCYQRDTNVTSTHIGRKGGNSHK